MAAQTISEVADTHWSATRRTVRPEVVDNFLTPMSLWIICVKMARRS